MPSGSWRGPAYPGDFPTLGVQVGTWIQDHCAIPDGDRMGDPYILTPEMWTFLYEHYALEADGRFTYRRSQLVRAQKWGKGPFSAAMICAEAEGPVLFDGWDADGEPLGRPWATPWIQVTAVSEDQTDNVWRALLPMIQLGSIGADIPDTGETRINLSGGGRIEPVTASARSRLGQRITFAVQDETHSWLKTNGGWRLADNQRRNLAGMSGRSIETTNAWDPNELSVAQVTYEAKVADVFKDFPDTPKGSFGNKRERRRVLKAVYGDSWWVDLDRIDAEIDELWPRDPAQAERFFGNRILTGSDDAFDLVAWRALGTDREVAAGELVTVGFDGSRFDDATALVATHVESGYQWPLGIWYPDPISGEIDADDVDQTVHETFTRYKVWRLYADPPMWDSHLDAWAGKYGKDIVVHWWTNRRKVMAYALRAYLTAIQTAELSHSGDTVLTEHIGNAKRFMHPQLRDEDGMAMWTIQKDRQGSPRKIDAAMAAVLSWEARGDAINAGALKPRKNRTLVFT